MVPDPNKNNTCRAKVLRTRRESKRELVLLKQCGSIVTIVGWLTRGWYTVRVANFLYVCNYSIRDSRVRSPFLFKPLDYTVSVSLCMSHSTLLHRPKGITSPTLWDWIWFFGVCVCLFFWFFGERRDVAHVVKLLHGPICLDVKGFKGKDTKDNPARRPP